MDLCKSRARLPAPVASPPRELREARDLRRLRRIVNYLASLRLFTGSRLAVQRPDSATGGHPARHRRHDSRARRLRDYAQAPSSMATTSATSRHGGGISGARWQDLGNVIDPDVLEKKKKEKNAPSRALYLVTTSPRQDADFSKTPYPLYTPGGTSLIASQFAHPADRRLIAGTEGLTTTIWECAR